MFANFEAGFSVIVPKGERPDGKTFRRLPTSKTDAQPGPEGLPEVQSWTVKHKARDLRASHVGFIASLRAEFDQRRGTFEPQRTALAAPTCGGSVPSHATRLHEFPRLISRSDLD